MFFLLILEKAFSREMKQINQKTYCPTALFPYSPNYFTEPTSRLLGASMLTQRPLWFAAWRFR